MALELGAESGRDLDMEAVFLNSVSSLAKNSLFGVPEDVCRTIEEFGPKTLIVILGTKALGDELIRASDRGIVAAVDDYPSDEKALYCGVPIISTDTFVEMAKKHPGMVAVNTCRKDAPKRFFDRVCRMHGIPHLNFEQAVRAFGLRGKIDHRMDDWGPDIVNNAEKYLALAERMEDSYSVQTLFGVLNFQLACDPEYFHHIERPYSTLYFRSGLFQLTQSESFVDCGACVGESLAGLIDVTKGSFARTWMIEPDRINFEKLRMQLGRLGKENLESRISLHQCAVGEFATKLPFVHSGGHGSSLESCPTNGESVNLVDVLPIDEIVDDVPTFIKMDVEGFELPALKGAHRVIKSYAPKLAVSAYHRSMDLLDITDYVLSLNPDYRVGLRHHTSDRWDTCLYFY